jgi:ketosteroid isomerase-like protein
LGEAADVVRLSYRRFNEGDLEGWLELISPRVEWHDVPEIPGARTYRGRDEAREFAEDLLDLAQRLDFTINELSESGNAVMADLYVDIVSRGGADLGWRAFTVFRVNEGLIRYHHGYSRREDALADFESPD